MAEKEIKLMKGNEVIAHAAIRYGCDAYFGYPITPQSEVMETLMELKPWETTGMVVLQAESEISSINMVLQGRRPRRLPVDRAGARVGAGDARFRGAGFRSGFQVP